MSKEVLLLVKSLSDTKGIDQDVAFQALEAALVMATKKRYGADWDVVVKVDRESGEYTTTRRISIVSDGDYLIEGAELNITEALAQGMQVKVGDVLESQIESVSFGRIDAQAAKHIILQKIREAERLEVVHIFADKVGQLFTAVVKKVTREWLLLDLGFSAEGLLQRSEMLQTDAFRIGDRVRAYLYDVHYEPRGPQLFFSRTQPGMLTELFRIEVPEIGEQIIQVMAAARDPGIRAKIAVKTNDGRIDPIGACIGMRGSRVQAVSNELGGERVDIVLWDDNPAQLVINAMAPAEIQSIVVDENLHSIDIAVKPEQLSQAIGRNGQNVRLASELTGWALNVMTPDEIEAKAAVEQGSYQDFFAEKLNLEEEIAAILVREGFTTLEEVAYVSLEDMLAIEEFDEDIVAALRERALEAIAHEAEVRKSIVKPAADLLTMAGMTEELAYRLAENGVITMEDLAELAIDDLVDIDSKLSTEHASQLIMKAREPWFAGDK